MKRTLLTLVLCLISIFAFADSYHFYTTFKSDGELTSYESIFDYYTVHIDDCVKAEYARTRYTSCTITVTLTVPVDEEDIEIYRCHADGTHKLADETNPNWNMKLQPSINPQWCYYTYQTNDEGKVTQFTFRDTFNEAILKNENMYVSTLHYLIYDNSGNPRHDIMIQISNIFAYSIITGIEDVNVDNSSAIYYDMNGRSSSTPFNGINIVKNGNCSHKIIH